MLDVTASIFNLSETSDISGFLTHSHATSAYDAVWTIATAWDTVLTRLDCEDDFDNVTNKLQLALEEISVSIAAVVIISHWCVTAVRLCMLS